MVGQDGVLPLPWLAEPLRAAQAMGRAHALLVHGPEGVGQFELAVTIAQAALCEAEPQGGRSARPCGRCASCRLVQARSHPDLLVLLPEVLRETLGWDVDAAAESGGADRAGKAKPSKEIKVDAIRTVVAFAQTTSARGRGKAVVIHPAERMNAIAANTLLKTLEEPPGDTRFVLSCAATNALLPTIRSRCQAFSLSLPERQKALDWLQAQGVARAEVLLAAAGGQPAQAVEWSQQGIDAGLWLRLPDMMRRGEAEGIAGWPLPRLIESLQKLCHDAMCHSTGAAPRYFPAATLGQAGELAALCEWARALSQASRQDEHPWHNALMLDSLVHQAQKALAPVAARRRSASSD